MNRKTGPGATALTRRVFVGGGLKATLAAGMVSRFSLAGLLAGPGTAGGPAARRFDGELIEESYGIAHRLRDGTLEIPGSLAPEGPLHDAIVLGGGVSGLMAAWELQRGGLSDVVLYEQEGYIGGNARKEHANGTDYTCATWSVVRPKDPFLLRLFQDLGVVQGLAADGTPRIDPALVGPGPDANGLIDGACYQDALFGADPSQSIGRMPLSSKERQDDIEFYRELGAWATKKGRDGKPAFALPVEEGR